MKNKVLISNIIKVIVIILISYLISFLYTNYSVLKNHNYSGNISLNDTINYSNFDEKSNEHISKIGSTIDYSFETPKYINTFLFNYKTDNDFSWTIKYNYLDLYGNVQTAEKSGTGSSTIDIFSEKLDKNIQKISIEFNNNNVSINDIRIQNTIDFFSITFIVFSLIGICMFILFINRNYFKNHVEYIFLIIALCGGICEIILTPIDGGISWDEQVHFSNAYHLLISKDTKATQELSDPQKYNFSLFNTKEEKSAYSKHLNEVDKVIISDGNNISFSFNKITYLPQSIAMFLCKIFNSSFTFLYVIGKLINLILYTIIIFFAIRKTPICKYTMIIIGLIPTAMFLACNYSYDPPITALILLGMGYLLYEMENKNILLSKKNLLIILVSFIIASCPKAIYAFLILFLLLLPKSKFNSNKNCKAFKIFVILTLLLMVSTFILPTVTSPTSAGDIRGGNTSVSGQIAIIMHSPLSFAKVFWNNAVLQFFNKFFNVTSIESFSYLGSQSSNNIYYLFLILLFLSLIINNNKQNYNINLKFKILTMNIIAIITVMIWLALYLSFTPVGSLSINGVQNRYFIPLIFPLILLFYSNKIKCEIDDKKIYSIMTISLLLITFLPMLKLMIY
jgi:uncharacterized membrane protein